MFVVVDDNAVAREFVSFCLERRGHKWPDLYDEMCRVASYRLFRDMGYRELTDHGVSLSLSNMETLAALAENLASSRASCRTS
jgi:CheY-like chemotaxis protein